MDNKPFTSQKLIISEEFKPNEIRGEEKIIKLLVVLFV